MLPYLFCSRLHVHLHRIAQQNRRSRKKIPESVKKGRDQYITLTLENDSLASGRDKNYTHGTRLTYFDSDIMPEKLGKFAEEIVPNFDVNDTTIAYFSLGQNLYTPEDIELRTPDKDDRPYAGFLYGSLGFDTVRDNHIDGVELTLGVVGPAALGRQTQESVHDVLGAKDPAGWDYQLKDEPALMIAGQRHWPDFQTFTYDNLFLRLSPHVNASLGNVYTYAGTGATLQLMPKQHKWQAPPLRVRPAIPGNGYFKVPQNHFSWSLFTGFESRYMIRNIFLDGNSFKNSPSVDKKPLVHDANAGISLTFGKTQLAYTLNWRSKEFDGQDEESLFGALSIARRF